MLDALEVRWYVFGAQAAIVHGAERLTADVDVTVHQGEHDVRELVQVLRRAGFSLRVRDIDDFVRRTRILPFRHMSSGIDLDLVLGGPGPEDLFASRARRRKVEGVRVPVATAEDVIAMKILAGRPKDLEDVVQICAAKGKRLRQAEIRGTLALLEEALDQRDLLPAFEGALERARPGALGKRSRGTESG